MDMKDWTVHLTLKVPADCTAEQIEAALAEVVRDQLDSWEVVDVIAVKEQARSTA